MAMLSKDRLKEECGMRFRCAMLLLLLLSLLAAVEAAAAVASTPTPTEAEGYSEFCVGIHMLFEFYDGIALSPAIILTFFTIFVRHRLSMDRDCFGYASLSVNHPEIPVSGAILFHHALNTKR